MSSRIRDDVHEFLSAGRVESAKFTKKGDSVTGKVLDAEKRQQRDFESGAPLVWDDGSPREQIVITLQTDQRDPAVSHDDGTRRVYARGAMLQSLRNTLRTGQARLEPGGTITVTYTGDAEPTKVGLRGAKQYTVAYEGPPAGFSVDELPPDDHDDDDEPF